jgi:bilirubin oxidase
LHWANHPAESQAGTWPSRTPGPYTDQPHYLHGDYSAESDGHRGWYLPAANNLPGGSATVGSFYDKLKDKFQAKFGAAWEAGTAIFQYENDQRASTEWFHDHALGITRLNVYAGPAGFYLLRGGSGDVEAGVLPGPAPQLGDAAGTKYYEIPIAIQDRSFNSNGSLFYPSSREFFDGFEGPYVGEDESDISPIWNPEFFGNTMVQRPHLALPRGRGQALSLPLPQRLQLPLLDPQAGIRSDGGGPPHQRLGSG